MRKILFGLFILVPNFLIAQKDFFPGYIINNNSDTIKCLIDINSDNYKCKVSFIDSSKIITYRPFEIKAYRFNDNKYFISKVAKVQKTYIKNQQVEFNINEPLAPRYVSKKWYDHEGYNQDSVFMEYLIEGKVKVFYYLGLNKLDHYFIQKDNDTIIDLTQEDVKSYENGVLFSEDKSESYKAKLYMIMFDCPKLQREIKSTKLKHKDLIKVSKDYHYYMCNNNNCTIFEKEIKPVKYDVVARYGLGFSQTNKLKVVSVYEDISPSFTEKGTMFIGIDLCVRNYISNREKISLIFGFEVINNNYQFNYNSGNSALIENIKPHMNYQSIDLVINEKVAQRFSLDKKSPFISCGLSQLFSLKESYNDVNSSSLMKHYLNDDNFKSTNRFAVGFNVALGYDILINSSHHLSIEILCKQFIINNQFNAFLDIGYEF